MALHDVDLRGLGRGAPLPNGHDTLDHGAVMAHGTNSVNYVTDASEVDSLNPGKNGQFTIVQAGSTTISDAFTTSNPGAGNFVSDGSTLFTQAHGLGFIPGVTGYLIPQGTSYYTQMPYTAYFNSGTTQALWISLFLTVDITNLYIQVFTMTYGGSWNINIGSFKWFLMQQTSN